MAVDADWLMLAQSSQNIAEKENSRLVSSQLALNRHGAHPPTASVIGALGKRRRQGGRNGMPVSDKRILASVSARPNSSCYVLSLSLSFLPFTSRFRHSMSTGFHSMSAPSALPYSVAFPSQSLVPFLGRFSQTPVESPRLRKPPLSDVKARSHLFEEIPACQQPIVFYLPRSL